MNRRFENGLGHPDRRHFLKQLGLAGLAVSAGAVQGGCGWIGGGNGPPMWF
jgi:hypothetical protein